VAIDARDFRLELIGELNERRFLFRIGRRERRAEMIEREIDVVERVSNLVRDGGGEPSDDGAFLCLVQLRFQLARASEFRCHLVEGGRECAHLVAPFGLDLDVEVSRGDVSRRDGELFDRTREAPDEETGYQRCDEQDSKSQQR